MSSETCPKCGNVLFAGTCLNCSREQRRTVAREAQAKLDEAYFAVAEAARLDPGVGWDQLEVELRASRAGVSYYVDRTFDGA